MVWLIDWIGLLVTKFYTKALGVYIGNATYSMRQFYLMEPGKTKIF